MHICDSMIFERVDYMYLRYIASKQYCEINVFKELLSVCANIILLNS